MFEEVQKIEKIILEKLRFNYRFESAISRREREDAPAPNINFDDKGRREEIAQIPAFLRTYFCMTDIREWLGKDVRDETSDKLIYGVLNALAKCGKVIFLQINHILDARYDEFQFYVEVGLGWSAFAITDNKSEVMRFYQDAPLTKSEIAEGKGILDVEKAVEVAFQRLKKSMEMKFGKPVDLNIERQLNKDEHDAKTEIGLATLEIAKALKDKEKTV
jgi:C-terminal processing protease CtpA/Prc